MYSSEHRPFCPCPPNLTFLPQYPPSCPFSSSVFPSLISVLGSLLSQLQSPPSQVPYPRPSVLAQAFPASPSWLLKPSQPSTSSQSQAPSLGSSTKSLCPATPSLFLTRLLIQSQSLPHPRSRPSLLPLDSSSKSPQPSSSSNLSLSPDSNLNSVKFIKTQLMEGAGEGQSVAVIISVCLSMLYCDIVLFGIK